MLFHHLLKEKRNELKWSQQDVAEKLFISNKTYSQYERGTRNADTEMLFQIIELLNIDIDDVLTVDINALKRDFSEYPNEITLDLPRTRITKNKRGLAFLIIARFYNHIQDHEKGEESPLLRVTIDELKDGGLKIQLNNVNGVYPYITNRSRNEMFKELISNVKNGAFSTETFGNHITPMLAMNNKINSYHFEGNANNGTILTVII